MAISSFARRLSWQVRAIIIITVAIAAASCGKTPAIGASSQSFGDAHSRWQLKTPDGVSTSNSVLFAGGLVLVSTPAVSAVQVTAYREATGAKVWSRSLGSVPELAGNILLAFSYSPSTVDYLAAGPCPASISRINVMTGAVLWMSQVPSAACASLSGSAPSASGGHIVLGETLLSSSAGTTLMDLPSSGKARAFRDDILIQEGSALALESLQSGRLHAVWRQNIAGYNIYPGTQQIMASRGNPGQPPGTVALINPGNGSIGRSIASSDATPTQRGLDVLTLARHLDFLSTSGIKQGPKSNGYLYAGGILWDYHSPNGYSTGPVYAYATAADSFKPLGKLVTTRSQVSAEGNDSFVASDGRYAAIVADPVIYIFKL
jgi:hypothetical protein